MFPRKARTGWSVFSDSSVGQRAAQAAEAVLIVNEGGLKLCVKFVCWTLPQSGRRSLLSYFVVVTWKCFFLFVFFKKTQNHQGVTRS